MTKLRTILLDALILFAVSTVFVVLADRLFSGLKGKIPKDDPVVTAIGQGDLKAVGAVIAKLEVDPATKAKATLQMDAEGRTSLMRAAYANLSEAKTLKELEEVRMPMITMLLDHGAPLNAQDHDGWTAVMWGAWSGMSEVTDGLIGHGANLSLTDKQGNTALIIAAGRGYSEVVKILLAKGADKDARNKVGETALAAAEKGMAEHPVLVYKTNNQTEGETGLILRAKMILMDWYYGILNWYYGGNPLVDYTSTIKLLR
jgi:hypothetical protein